MWIEMVGNVLLIVTALINIEVIYRYHRITQGTWRDTPMGRHVMAYMAATGLVLTLASIRLVVINWFESPEPIWFQALRVLTYVTLPMIFLWRRHLIVKAHKSGVKEN